MKTRIFIILGIVVALVGSLTSCQELMDLILGKEGVTITERVDQFVVTLNDDNRTLADFKSHLSPTMLNYDQIDWDTIEAGPLSTSNADFIIGTPSVADNVATCTFENVNGATGTIVLTMALDGSDHKIKKITLTLASAPDDPYELKKLSA